MLKKISLSSKKDQPWVTWGDISTYFYVVRVTVYGWNEVNALPVVVDSQENILPNKNYRSAWSGHRDK